MPTLILPLDSSLVSLPLAGGKGVNLGTLINQGLPVPRGFVITTTAYDTFLKASRFEGELAQLLAQADPQRPSSLTAISQSIRQRFTEIEIPPHLRDELLAARTRFFPAGEPLAVRSSATAEDLPTASFAGQQESYLNVVGAEPFLQAVVHCWSSLWTDRAIAYRTRQKIDSHEVSLAVVVQPLLSARSAGVLFTLDPVSRDPTHMMVNATWGLGEALVGGEVDPDQYVLDRATGRVLHCSIGEKREQTTLQAQGVMLAPTPAADRSMRVLTDHQLGRLADLGRQIEALFGQPQDVEWAVVGEDLFILQARPITGLPAREGLPGDDAWPPLTQKPAQPFDLWTQADLGERWPDPVTPLTWSTWQPITEKSMQDSFNRLREPWLAEIQWTRRVYGRAYLNEGALAYALHWGYGMPAASFSEGMGGAPELVQEYSRWRWGIALRRAPLLASMVLKWNRLIDQYEQEFPRIDQWVKEFQERNLADLSDQALWEEARQVWYARALTYLDSHAAATSQSMNAYTQMESLLTRWLGDPSALQTLVTGIDGVLQAEIVPMLWSLTQTVRRQGLSHLFLENDGATALEQLNRHPQAEPVLSQLALFLERHGHRCAIEAEWLHPRWWEQPAQVIEQISGYLQADETFDPSQSQRSQKALRLQTEQEVQARLNPLQALIFRRSLARLHRLIRMRDNGQHYLVKLILPIRHIYGQLAHRWAKRELLDQARDFFFLAEEEIGTVIGRSFGEGGQDELTDLNLPQLAADRRLAWEYWMAQSTFPSVLDAAGRPTATPSEENDENSTVLQGIGASPGRATGRARVILSPAEAVDLKPGDILVTRSTDPGWTPVFALIGGVVLEMGGQLSHGAIVAREYGLPAVLNVRGATRRIRDGQQISVDGGSGQVWLDPLLTNSPGSGQSAESGSLPG